MNDLSEKMIERLERWRKSTQSATSPQKAKAKQKNYVPRGNYGDDLRDLCADADECEQDTKYNR
jgi:hypothetical protein